jgi:rhodanese-related sulfurtransferase|nr:rhodanese-like domain-containing protein [uncultured Emticicia sp.]
MNIEKIIQEKRGTIVDVRTPEEFRGGHVAGAVNIPLSEVLSHVEELKALTKPVVLCCASGNRSGQAHRFLQQHGLECYNGGSWLNVNYCQSLASA